MTQSKRGSLAESLTNVAIGYGIAILTQVIVFPLFGIHASIGQNIGIGACFTVVSIARSYCIRRLYNYFNFFSRG